MLAAFAEILACWSKSAHFTLNLTLFNRLPLHPDVQRLVGDFTSLTLLEVDYTTAEPFVDRARRLGRQLWDDLDHRLFSGLQVMRELARASDHGATGPGGPLMPVVFTSILNPPEEERRTSEGAAEEEPESESGSGYSITQTPQVWIDHQVREVDGALSYNWDAVEELFPDGLLDAAFAAYSRLLEELADGEDAWQANRRSPVPRQQLASRAAVNDTVAPVPAGLLHEGFLEQARRHPEAIAVIAADREITYGQLAAGSRRLGRTLRAAGARPNRLVAVVMDKGWEQVLAVLGILQSGGAYLPVAAGLPAARRRYLLEHGEVEVALVQSGWDDPDWPADVEQIAIDESWLAPDDGPPVSCTATPEDLAYVIFTSGSTGRPKGVMIDHRGALNTVTDVNQRFAVAPGDRVLGISALHFDLSVYDVFGILAAGATLVLPEPFQTPDPAAWLDLLEVRRVTLWNSVPALLEMVVEAAAAGPAPDLSALRLVMLSGDWIPLSLPDRIRDLAGDRREPLELISMGGATEVSIWSILYPIAEIEAGWSSVPYGKPMVNQTFHVLDEALRPCPVWTPGDLYIGGVGLAHGYWRDEEKTAAAFIDAPPGATPEPGEKLYRTGDLGRYLPDGNIEFLGREDLQVKIRGHRIELAEIEAALTEIEDVSSAVTIAVGEQRALSHLVSFVVAAGAAPEPAPAASESAVALSTLSAATPETDWRPPGSEPIQDKLAQMAFKLEGPGLRRDLAEMSSVDLLRLSDDRPFIERRSHREFRPEPLPVERLIAALAALDLPAHAGTIRTLVCVKPDRVAGLDAGLYRYHPTQRALTRLAEAEMRPQDTPEVNRPILEQAAFSIFLTAHLEQPETRELDEQRLLVLAGALGQQLMERAPSGLGFCPIGAYDFADLATAVEPDSGVLLHCWFGGQVGTEVHMADPARGLQEPERRERKRDHAPEPTPGTAKSPEMKRDGWQPPTSIPKGWASVASEHRAPEAGGSGRETLGHLLGALCQIRHPDFDLPKYRYPSAGNLYPVQTYVVVRPGAMTDVEAGVYYHHPRRHQLVRLATEPSRVLGLVGEDAGGVALLLVAKPGAIAPIYGDLARPFCLLEAGYMQQLLATAAAETDLALRPLAVAPAVVPELFDLDEPHVLVGGLFVESAPADQTATAPEAAAASERDDDGRLREALKASLPAYMVPDRIIWLDALPLTANGKVDRAELNRRASSLGALEAPAEAADAVPRTEREQLICNLIRDQLAVEQVGIHDSFFELGGHSVTATQLAARIGKAFQVAVPLRELFAGPTAAEMAELVERQRASGGEVEALPAVLQRDPQNRHLPFPLTDVQEAYWVGRSAALELSSVASHAYLEVDLPDLDVDRLTLACRRLIERHGMLRAIVLADGRQQILETVPPYEIALLDLRDADPEEAERRLLEVRHEMSHQVLPADRWPLFEIRASRRDEKWHRLHVSLDLLIGDAWSFQLMREELAALYLDPDVELPALELSFRDYVLAEHALRESAAYQRALAYWRGRLTTLPGAPELPLAQSPSTIAKPTFVRRRGELEPAAWEALQQRASSASLTPSIVLLAAFAEVLATWSKSRRFILNLTLFNRLPLDHQVHRIVGDFTSLTLLETHVPAALSFADRARRHQQQLWDDLDHRLVSGVRVLREWARARGGTPAALAPVVFTSILHQRDGDEEPEADGEEGGAVFGVSQTPQVWLDHQVREVRGALLYSWDAVEELFPADLLDEMFAAFEGLLRRLASDDGAWEETRRTLVPASQLDARAAVNATAEPLPEGLLHSGFLARARQQGAAPAVIAADRTVSYGELAVGSALLATELRRAGAATGRLVAVVMEKGWEQVLAVLGILRSGAAYLPVDPSLPRERREFLLAHGEVEVALTQPWLADSLDWPAGVEVVTVEPERLAEGPDSGSSSSGLRPEGGPRPILQAIPELASPESLAYVIFTSGSTGLPKGVMIDHRGALNTVADVNRRFDVTSEDRVLALSSLSFDLSVYDVFGPLAAGAAIVMPAPGTARDPAHWADLVRRHRVSIWNSVPALMEMMVEYLASRDDFDLGSLRLAMWSGDWIPIDLPARTRALVAGSERAQDLELVSLGGATEASIWSILYPISEVDPDWISIPYGQPMVNQGFHVLDADLQPCPVWTPGELYISGAGLALGYWREATKTASRFVTALPDPAADSKGRRLYRTGDLGRYLPDGNIEFLGREDSQVKIRGHRIELGEIETTLLAHPAVQSTVVEAAGEPRGDRRLVAGIVPEPSAAPAAEALLVEELRAFLASRLPAYMVPATFLRLDALPLTANGKVDRAAFSRMALAESQAQAPAARSLRGPSTEMEETLSGIWRQILGQETIAVDDNFFELGGTSVQLVRAYNLLRETVDREVALVELFEHPTLADLAAFLTSEEAPATAAGAGDPTDAEQAVAEPSRQDRIADRKSRRKQRRKARLKRRRSAKNEE